MKISHSLEPHEHSPCVLTLGTFDGIHLGHQMLLKEVTDLAKAKNLPSVILTFSNHPSTVLRPQSPTPLLCSIPHKMHLLEEMGIDHLVLLPFTKEFSNQSANQFLNSLRSIIPFRTIVLGSDATLGKNREGDQRAVVELSKKLDFNPIYLSDYNLNKERISSSKIRQLLQLGSFNDVELFLGRKYSIYGEVIPGKQVGKTLGFPTLNISINDLCTPPFGVYVVTCKWNGTLMPAVANLGRAPTLDDSASPLLEVHILDNKLPELYGAFVEIIFEKFIRFEKKFQDTTALTQQITEDAFEAENYFKSHLRPYV